MPFAAQTAPLLGFLRLSPNHRHPFRLPQRLPYKNMSRNYKIALILKSRSSLPIYKDLARLSDRELDEHVYDMIRRMRHNETAAIARMVIKQATFSLN